MSKEQAEVFFSNQAKEIALYGAIEQMIDSIGPATISVTRSQISFATKTKFAWVWLPLPWGKRPEHSLVLTFAVNRHIEDPQIEETVEPYPGRWTHHVIIQEESDLNERVLLWLQEAYAFSQRK